MNKISIIPVEVIENKIYLIRGQKVMLDRDLAKLYEIETRVLKQAVKRNIKRFPKDFMFTLAKKEIDNMVSQFVIPSRSQFGGSKPFVFTEQGVAMLSTVLNSEKAIEINILIIRAFVKLREILSSNMEIAQKLKELEQKYETHDEQITAIFEAINNLLAPPQENKRKMGFQIREKKILYK